MHLLNPENHRMTGIYAEEFGNCRRPSETLARRGFRVKHPGCFYDCASDVNGTKP